jgi:hypothetical protein
MLGVTWDPIGAEIGAASSSPPWSNGAFAPRLQLLGIVRPRLRAALPVALGGASMSKPGKTMVTMHIFHVLGLWA